MSSKRSAVLGNTRAIAVVRPDGTLAWLALPGVDDRPVFNADAPPPALAGAFTLTAPGATATREYVGETNVLRTTYELPNGSRANVIDFLPLRPDPAGGARIPHDRLVRVVEGLAGEVTFEVHCAPAGAHDLQFDPNGLLFGLGEHHLVFQTEVEMHQHGLAVTGSFAVRVAEKRHFVLTLVQGEDPDVPEMRITEPEWDLDGTFDFWLMWARRCPFQGVQRAYILKLAAWLKASWVPPGRKRPPTGTDFEGFGVLAPLALAAWGWDQDLAATLMHWPTRKVATAVSGEALSWLALGQDAGVLDSFAIADAWPLWRALANQPDAAPILLRAAARLADDLALEGDPAGWLARAGDAETPVSADFDALLEAGALDEAVGAIAAELDGGAYLQARRRMDRWLQAFEPFNLDLAAGARALWLAARIYLIEPPAPGRVELPGDLGE